MNEIQSIFAQMRKSRMALNESEEDTKEKGNLNESEEDTKGVEGAKESEGVIEESEGASKEGESLDESEEFVVIRCADCGSILSSLDEAEEGCPACGSDNLDEKTVRVVRDGKVVKKKVPTRKKRLSPAQKAALAKARKKAHTASANKARAKSNKVRRRKGLNEGDVCTCPECGFEAPIDEFEEEDGVIYCPECGAEI